MPIYLEAIPAASKRLYLHSFVEEVMRSCSAPGKMILFGEHAVVFGKPALAMAVDLRVKASVNVSDQYSVNGHPMRARHHAYISAALDEAWDGPPLSVTTKSSIPSGSGLGSSAAVTVSTIGAILAERGQFDAERVARKAFEVEYLVQRRASPTDTSASTHGSGILVSPDRLDGFLWRIEKGTQEWNIHHCDVRKLTFVVGYTGVHAPTGPLVQKVKEFVESDAEGRKAIDRIGEIVMDGADAVAQADKPRLGALMRENHSLLCELGVGHPSIDKLIESCSEMCYGEKITGAGGGGSIIALTDAPKDVSEAISAVGGRPIIVRVGGSGVLVERQ
ncbi:MAG: mevalonate kinase [Thermoplasmata archaeon]|nr:mevalonate kinase [Thermoplasmata archaeon]